AGSDDVVCGRRISDAESGPLLLLDGVLAKLLPGRVGDRVGSLGGAGKPEIERYEEGSDGQNEQHEDIDDLAQQTLFGRTIGHGVLLDPALAPHFVEMLEVEAVNEVAVIGVVAQHR